MPNDVKRMLESLGEWFEFKVIEEGQDLYVVSAYQWYHWTGTAFQAVSKAKVPERLWGRQPARPKVW